MHSNAMTAVHAGMQQLSACLHVCNSSVHVGMPHSDVLTATTPPKQDMQANPEHAGDNAPQSYCVEAATHNAAMQHVLCGAQALPLPQKPLNTITAHQTTTNQTTQGTSTRHQVCRSHTSNSQQQYSVQQ
jgi:hypothetical protein